MQNKIRALNSFENIESKGKWHICIFGLKSIHIFKIYPKKVILKILLLVDWRSELLKSYLDIRIKLKGDLMM